MIYGRIHDGKYYRLSDGGEYVSSDGAVLGDTDSNRSSRAAICEKNPWVSTAGAVHADQVEKFNRELVDNKVRGAYYRKDGNLVCTSRGARNRVLKMRNLRDGDAGYGDYAGR
jgi:hypothetical protein